MARRDPFLYLGNEKRCSKCRQYKDMTTGYHKHSRSKYGIESRCKDCICQAKRKYKDPIDRFWKFYHAHYIKSGDCLEWTGRYNNRGIPVCNWQGKENIQLRRVLYRLTNGDPPADMCIMVSCHNKRCVRQSHLKLATHEEFDTIWRSSAAARERHGLYKHPDRRPRGETHGNAVLTEEKVRAMRERYSHGDISLAEVGAQFGVNQSTAQGVICGKRWGHVDGVIGPLPMGRLVQGERNVHAKLTESDVYQIRNLHANGMSCAAIARLYGRGNTTIRHILRGENWKHIPAETINSSDEP